MIDPPQKEEEEGKTVERRLSRGDLSSKENNPNKLVSKRADGFPFPFYENKASE